MAGPETFVCIVLEPFGAAGEPCFSGLPWLRVEGATTSQEDTNNLLI